MTTGAETVYADAVCPHCEGVRITGPSAFDQHGRWRCWTCHATWTTPTTPPTTPTSPDDGPEAA